MSVSALPRSLDSVLTRLRDVVPDLGDRVPWRNQAARMFDLELDARTAEVHLAISVAKGRKRRHDMVNAFMAVEGASIILARESLDASDRTKLSEVLESGMQRLRAMIVSDEGATVSTVALAQVAESLAEDMVWQGRLEVAVEAGLVGSGSPYEIIEAARQLLGHGNRRSPTTPLTLRGERCRDRVVLWVEDRGPETSGRRRHWPAGDGSVTGLHVATRLVQQQGGTVQSQARPGGGTSFGISLPAIGVPVLDD